MYKETRSYDVYMTDKVKHGHSELFVLYIVYRPKAVFSFVVVLPFFVFGSSGSDMRVQSSGKS